MNLSLSDKLNHILESISSLYAEGWLAVLFIALIIIELFLTSKKKLVLGVVALIGLAINFLFIQKTGTGNEAPFMLGLLAIHKSSLFFKYLFNFSGMVVILMMMLSGNNKQEDFKNYGEFYSLFIAIILGLNLMAMANNLLMVYLSIELVSITSYVLTVFKFDKKGAEGGIKYLLFGAISSGVMLYGMSLLYGFSGSLVFSEIASGLAHIPTIPVIIALGMTLGGLFFKISAAPFHIWTPDVYEAAPTPLVAFFSVAPKAAGIAVLLTFIQGFENFVQEEKGIIYLLGFVAGLSILIGNFSAIWQKSAKRMLAYSSIAHSGFLLLAIIPLSASGYSGLYFYLGIYVFMNFAAFVFIQFFEETSGNDSIEKMKGTGLSFPVIGILVVTIMIALTGLPITAGFTAKLFIFSALWEAYQNSGEGFMLTLFIFGLFNTLIALFYYLKIPFFMFFRPNENQQFSIQPVQTALLVVLTLPLIFFFFKPDVLTGFLNTLLF
ncbi:NADH-quinone oxidoreductase subunit N [Flexithrix dorotheae]|uniref:NADH-quinone oxidoreductase subunit N n=1 Tax=Flexithrix dorotheae TaxID=70993 RepID=UPI000368F9BA|nr:NADH-quinone oxidoreductase subunit N [Flexithrix dorotheae]